MMFSILLPTLCLAQEWEQIAEKYTSLYENESEFEAAYEALLNFYTQPLNLNQATWEELISLPIITTQMASSLVEHRLTFGPLISFHELQVVHGYSPAIIRDLRPFIAIDEKATPQSLLTRIRKAPTRKLIFRQSQRLQQSRGFNDEGAFQGNPAHLYTRLIWRKTHDFSLGLTVEKDPGEDFHWQKGTPGFDFISFHFQVRKQGIIDNLVIGDHQLSFGQGLVYGAGFGLGKGSETITSTIRSNRGILPYTSVIENGFHRGIGVTMGRDKLKISSTISRLPQDGRVQNDSSRIESPTHVQSIRTTGLHRTVSEIDSRRSFAEYRAGINIEYQPNRRLNLGVNHLHTHYTLPLLKRQELFNQFEFKGQHNHVSSVYYRYLIQNIVIFGENAISKYGGSGHVMGMILPITNRLDYSLLHRLYQPDFHSFSASGFGENSRTINEQGLYWGLKWQPNRKNIVTAYYDWFEFPWLKYLVDEPSNGHEYLISYTYQPKKSRRFSIQYRMEEKGKSISTDSTNFNSLVPIRKHNLVCRMQIKVNSWLTMKSRVQGSQVRKLTATSRGVAMAQDVDFSWRKLKVSNRFAVFSTEDFDNRHYMYEKEVLYAFSIPSYSGNGIRMYTMMQYPLNRKLKIWMRYSIFQYTDRETIGSGNDEIQGNLRSDLRVQMEWNI